MEDSLGVWLSRTEEDYGHYEKWNTYIIVYVYFLGYYSILPVFMDFHTSINPLIFFPIKIIYCIILIFVIFIVIINCRWDLVRL